MTFFGRTPAASPEFTPPATVQSIAVLGAGSWGTAFAKIAADAARERGDDFCQRYTDRMKQGRVHITHAALLHSCG